jgi:hypothetical protein
MWIPDIRSLELDITYACGFGCNNCNRMTVLAPGTRDTNVTVEQVQKLIHESIELNWPWRTWGVIGGEPTVHPQFWEILETIVQYRLTHNPSLLIRVSTHGAGERTTTILDRVAATFPFVHVRNSAKTTTLQNDFVAINVAPKDWADATGVGSVYSGCWIPANCGVGFNYAGFYCCAVAGAIDRICGDKLAIKSLRQVTPETLVAQYAPFCSMCGHYRPNRAGSEHKMSPSWKAAFEEYRRQQPALGRY